MSREDMNILHTNLFESGLIDDNSALTAGYPLTNLDLRSRSIVTRITGDGSQASPKYIDIDLGAVNLVEALAVFSNVHHYGSIIAKGARTGFPVGSWDWEVPLLSYRNMLQNGGMELGTFSNVQPADGDSDVIGLIPWDSTSGTSTLETYVGKLQYGFPISWDSDSIVDAVPNVYDYPSKYFGRINSISGTSSAYQGAFCLTPVTKVTVGEKYICKGKYRYPVACQPGSGGTHAFITLASVNAALSSLDNVQINLELSDVTNDWIDFELELDIVNDTAVYLAIAFLHVVSSTSGGTIDIDDVTIEKVIDPLKTFNFTDNLEDTGCHLVILNEDKTQIRALRLEFINDINGNGFIDVGRILMNQNFLVCAAPPINYNTDLGHVIDITQTGIPYITQRRGTRRAYNVRSNFVDRGTLDSLRKIIEDTQEDQVYVSIFEETRKMRGLLGAFAGNIDIQEGPLPNFANFRFSVKEER